MDLRIFYQADEFGLVGNCTALVAWQPEPLHPDEAEGERLLPRVVLWHLRTHYGPGARTKSRTHTTIMYFLKQFKECTPI